MSFDVKKPADNQTIAAGPAEIRENCRALKNDKIVNAQKVMDLSPGNSSGNIPVANGNLCVNLNAEKLGGNLASAFAAAGHTHGVATTSGNGLMSNTDKTKLDGIAAGAEVNQNAFSNVLVGTTNITADGKTDTLELAAGTNITLTPDATNDRVTIGVMGTVASANTAAACTGNAATATNAINHINASSGAHVASSISCTATGDVAATNVQAAIAELASEKVPTSDVVTAPTANKLLKLNSSGVLPASITGNATTAAACTGNAATTTKLQNARTINGVAFDGLANINITQVNGKDIITDNDHSFIQNGYQKLSNGLILQWGMYTSTLDGSQAFDFPIPFPNLCFAVTLGAIYSNFSLAWSQTQFTFNRDDQIDGSQAFGMMAIGY
jgi:hypothetical protein